MMTGAIDVVLKVPFPGLNEWEKIMNRSLRRLVKLWTVLQL
jgi:hypothetical protein